LAGISTAKIVWFRQSFTELSMHENYIIVLPVNILTGVMCWLLGPNDTLLCVLIILLSMNLKVAKFNVPTYPVFAGLVKTQNRGLHSHVQTSCIHETGVYFTETMTTVFTNP